MEDGLYEFQVGLRGCPNYLPTDLDILKESFNVQDTRGPPSLEATAGAESNPCHLRPNKSG